MSAKVSSYSSNKIDVLKQREQRLAGKAILLFPQISVYLGSPMQARVAHSEEKFSSFVNPSWKDLHEAASVFLNRTQSS